MAPGGGQATGGCFILAPGGSTSRLPHCPGHAQSKHSEQAWSDPVRERHKNTRGGPTSKGGTRSLGTTRGKPRERAPRPADGRRGCLSTRPHTKDFVVAVRGRGGMPHSCVPWVKTEQSRRGAWCQPFWVQSYRAPRLGGAPLNLVFARFLL